MQVLDYIFKKNILNFAQVGPKDPPFLLPAGGNVFKISGKGNDKAGKERMRRKLKTKRDKERKERHPYLIYLNSPGCLRPDPV